MNYHTGIHVSRLGIGTASLHHLFLARERIALLEAAFDSGITHFDTSPYYGYGLAEIDLGRALSLKRDAITITTKLGLYPWGPASGHAASVWLRKAIGKVTRSVSLPVVNWSVSRAKLSLVESLKRLRTDYVDFLLLHEPDSLLLQSDEMMAWLESEYATGRIRAWGLAGVASTVLPFVQTQHPLADVIQTKDSLEHRQAEFLLEIGRPLQFTYGYLSGRNRSERSPSAESVITAALRRNTTGTVLFSSRRVDCIRQLSKVMS